MEQRNKKKTWGQKTMRWNHTEGKKNKDEHFWVSLHHLLAYYFPISAFLE